MAEQRWSQRAGHGTRWNGRLGWLVVAGLALSIAACTADARDPVGITPPNDPGTTSGGGGDGGTGGGGTGGGGTGGGGTSMGGSAAEALVGAWENVVAIEMSGDFQTVRTRWDFRDSGGCRQTVSTFSVLDGMTFVTVRDCIFTINNGNVVISFTDAMASVSFSLSFPQFTRDRILLGGIPFDRTA